MARRKYPKYRSRYSSYGRRAAQRRNRRITVLAILIIVAVVVLIRQYGNDDVNSEIAQNPAQEIDILPDLTDESIVVNTADTGEGTAQPVPVLESEPALEPTPEPEPQIEPARPKPQVAEQKVPKAGERSKVVSDPLAVQLKEDAAADISAGNVIAARQKLNDTLDKQLSPTDYSRIKMALARLADEWLFSPKVLAGDDLTEYYVVQSGDNFSAIAKKYKVPYEVLMRINGISDPRKLRAGQKIKVVHGPFNAAIYKSTFTMDLYLQRTYVKSYKVGLGSIEHETPSGKWRVRPNDKLVRPNWTDPDTHKTYLASDPDYPLGERWIGIQGTDENTRDRTGFAIHGTKEPESIGKRASRGCIRLRNSDVVEVYGMLTTTDSQIYIYD